MLSEKDIRLILQLKKDDLNKAIEKRAIIGLNPFNEQEILNIKREMRLLIWILDNEIKDFEEI